MRPPKLLFLALALVTGLILAAAPAGAASSRAHSSASIVRIDGYVTDGVGHNWGVYAKVTLASGGSFGTATVFSSPQTGYYFADVYAGETYTITVEPVYSGYDKATAAVTPAAATVVNFPLMVGRGACTAPGYQKTASAVLATENFDSAGVGGVPAGWWASTSAPGGVWGAQTQATATGGTSPVSAPNLMQFSTVSLPVGQYGRLWRTPVNLTGFGAVLSFYLFQTASAWPQETVQVQVSTDGAVTWQDIGSPIPTASYATGWKRFSVPLDGFTGSAASVFIGLEATQTGYGEAVQIDNLELSVNQCTPVQGAMIFGNVRSTTSGWGVNEAVVSHDLGGSTLTFATPLDPDNDDGFYSLFVPIPGVPPAARNISAAKTGYDTAATTILVPADGVMRVNLYLASSQFLVNPSFLTIRANAGTTNTGALTIQNNGTSAGSYSILERLTPPKGYFPGVRPYRAAPVPSTRSVKPWKEFARTNSKRTSPIANATGQAAAYPGSNVDGATGVACDEFGYWVFGGTDEYTLDPVGDIWYYDARQNTWGGWPGGMPVPGAFMAGGCVNGYIYLAGGFTASGEITDAFRIFDTHSQKWVTDVMPTGPLAAQAGVVLNGKFYLSGGWDDVTPATAAHMVFDPATGTFSGLAPLPAPRFLHGSAAVGNFVYVAGGNDLSTNSVSSVYRYDPSANLWTSGPSLPGPRGYNPVFVNYGDQLWVAGGSPLGLFALPLSDPTTLRYNPSSWPAGSWSTVPTATLAAPVQSPAYAATHDRIWVAGGVADGGITVNLHQYIDEGLDTDFPAHDLPYVSENPVSGVVPAGAANAVTVTFDTNASDKFGLHVGQFVFTTLGPQTPTAVGFGLTKAFLDVPEGSFGDAEIHGLAGARITYGVPGSMYLPNTYVTRAEMAIFLTRATQGYAFIPPFPGPGMNSFADVTYDHWAANYIEFIFDPAGHSPINPIPQVTVGCALDPLRYCPDQQTTRAEMAAFICRAAFGGATHLEPSPVFADVPVGHPYRGYIEQLWLSEMTNGCGGGNYCPDRSITRAEMAIFLVRAFAIPYLH